MKFRIKRTFPLTSDKRDEKNPLWMFGTILLCWGFSLNAITKEFKPAYHRDFGRLLQKPYVDEKDRLHLSKKLVVSTYALNYINYKNVQEELQKGDVIWYVLSQESGFFSQFFGEGSQSDIIAFGTKTKTFLSEDDYINSIPERQKEEKRVALLMFSIPFLYFIFRYGFFDRANKEYGLHFYKYEN